MLIDSVTVGPQWYMRTTPFSSGSKVVFSLLFVIES